MKTYIVSVKFKSLHGKAKQLDVFIDDVIKSKRTNFVPMANLQETVPKIFPNCVMVNFGLHKIVFHLRHKTHELALKIGRPESIEVDHKAYKQMPRSLRHVYFARVFWHTKYCLLQEYGTNAEVSTQELEQIRIIASEYGLLDITCDNIKKINGNLKIIDASIAPRGLFGLWKIADTVKLLLPSRVRKLIRKSRMLVTVK